MANDLVVVFGGSGFVGKQVVRALAKHGKRIRIAMRRPHLGQDLRMLGDVGQIQLVQANVRFAESVDAALEGADAVVNLVAALYERGPQTFQALHVDAARAIAEAASKRGIKRFVQMSALGAAPKGSRYAKTKFTGENAVREFVPTAIVLRPSIIFGPEDHFFNRFAQMARNPVLDGMLGCIPLIGGGKTKFQPVFVGDVADAIVAALSRVDSRGRTYELGGPSVYSFRDLMNYICAETDRHPPLLPVPFVFAHPLGLLLGALSKFLPIDPPLTGDQVTTLHKDNIVGADPSASKIADLGVTSLESVEAIVPTYLWRFRPHGQFQTRQTA